MVKIALTEKQKNFNNIKTNNLQKKQHNRFAKASRKAKRGRALYCA